MHNKLSMTALAGVLALTTSGSDHGRTIQPSPIAFLPKKLDLATSLKPVPKPQNTSQKPDFPPGLIQSTDITQRLKQVQEGRPDPFTGMFPHFEVVEKPQKVFPDLPKLTTVKALPAPTKPTPPSTDLAKRVAIEGVVQAGDESHAIIKLPQDSTSRYVSEGQQLPGGELLVKRIEFPKDSDPLVVLEQNGIEIAKAVGEPVSEQTEETTDIASSMGASSDSEGNSEPSNSDASELAESEETDESTDTVASSKGAQNSDSLTDDTSASDSNTDDSDTSDSSLGEREAVEPVKVTQPIEEYTAAIPVPSPPPGASDSTKKPREKVAAPPAPTNYKPSVDVASIVEADPSETVLSSIREDSVRSAQASFDRAGQDQVGLRQYTSSEAGSVNQPLTASANVDDLTERQKLIERLRTSSGSPVGNKIESNWIPPLRANVEGTPKQQLINQLRSEKTLTSDELLTEEDSRVLLHKQQLINQLRSSNAMSSHK